MTKKVKTEQIYNKNRHETERERKKKKRETLITLKFPQGLFFPQ
jgi:hypothetical protein